MRLIDADKFKEYILQGIDGLKVSEEHYGLATQMTKDFLKDIDEQPTVDVCIHNDTDCKPYKQLYEETQRQLIMIEKVSDRVRDKNAEYIETIQELKGKLNENKDS